MIVSFLKEAKLLNQRDLNELGTEEKDRGKIESKEREVWGSLHSTISHRLSRHYRR